MFWENAFTILALPTGATLLLFLYYQVYKKEKKPFQMYFNLYFSLMLIKLFFFTIHAHANEYIKDSHTIKNIFIESEVFDHEHYSNGFFEIRKREELFFLKDIRLCHLNGFQQFEDNAS